MFNVLTVHVSFPWRKKSDSPTCVGAVSRSDGPALVKLALQVEPRHSRRQSTVKTKTKLLVARERMTKAGEGRRHASTTTVNVANKRESTSTRWPTVLSDAGTGAASGTRKRGGTEHSRNLPYGGAFSQERKGRAKLC